MFVIFDILRGVFGILDDSFNLNFLAFYPKERVYKVPQAIIQHHQILVSKLDTIRQWLKVAQLGLPLEKQLWQPDKELRFQIE